MKTPVIKMIKPQALYLGSRCISDWDELLEVRQFLREQGLKVVLTSGTWDILHIGQALYLHKAKAMGDVLIVGVDSDALTKYRKGPKRPIVPEDERTGLLGLLGSVDFITLLEDDRSKNGEALVRMLKPDVFVMSETTKNEGEDHAAKWKKIYEEEGICKVEILEPQALTSTTNQLRMVALEGQYESVKELLLFIKNKFPDHYNEITANGNTATKA